MNGLNLHQPQQWTLYVIFRSESCFLLTYSNKYLPVWSQCNRIMEVMLLDEIADPVVDDVETILGINAHTVVIPLMWA
jgi:hypothetical protein